MRTGRIICQQIVQLRWHLLASLGLIMVLPLEEAAVNFKDGAGFYSIGASLAVLWMTPLLAGLIACANVQADMEDRKYLFWRSKPVRAWIFILLKFLTGLGVSFVVLAVPFLFTWISTAICTKDKSLGLGDLSAVLFLCLLYLPIPIMTYSLCFFSNVLVRKTARAWLIGMAAAGLVLLVPFFLPINLKKTVCEEYPILLFMFPAVAAAAALAVFLLSLWAVRHDRRLRTNLKGLLWAAAGILFALMLFFGRQVANIKVLDEKKSPDPYLYDLNTIDDKVLLGYHYAIGIRDRQINFEDCHAKPFPQIREELLSMPPEYKIDKNLEIRLSYSTMGWPTCYHQIGDNTFAFGLFSAVLEKKDPNKSYTDCYFKNLYLRSFQFQEGTFLPVSTVELSDLLVEEERPLLGMRIIEDKLIVLINRSCVVAEISSTGTVQILKKYPNHTKIRWQRLDLNRQQEFLIPLVPAEQIPVEQRIKLSIDWYNWKLYRSEQMFDHTITDRHGETIRFYVLSEVEDEQYELARYEVVRWDKQSVYCKFKDSRPFTFLEQLFGGIYDHRCSFVQKGKFYFYTYQKLMVFDVRFKRIRKLGHFERTHHHFSIEDIAVLEDGNILIAERKYDEGREILCSLHLLENPE